MFCVAVLHLVHGNTFLSLLANRLVDEKKLHIITHGVPCADNRCLLVIIFALGRGIRPSLKNLVEKRKHNNFHLRDNKN